MADTKDTIYIDIDDEITTIIDKVSSSSNKVVALVLPKRASALQSIVNMKLLKRSVDQSNKNLVLITSESSLMPLAGAVGLYVAKTPTSRPEIPAAPGLASSEEEQVDEIDLDDDSASPILAANKPVGELAAASALLPVKPEADSGVETLELDNSDLVAPAAAPADKKAKKPKKDKKLAVPDFNKFRLFLILGGVLLLVLLVGGYFAFAVLPKATISVQTNASNVNTDVDFTLSTAATNFDESKAIVPAKQAQTQKTLVGSANASGQKNNGQKATGKVSIKAQACAPNINKAPADLQSGTGISSGGKTYITQSTAKFNFEAFNGGSCATYKATNEVQITSQLGGANNNLDADTSFKISSRSDITSITGSADGGTDDIQTIVSQADIDSAKAKITAGNATEGQQELADQLKDQNLYAITSTYSAGTPVTTTSANVGDAASNVTVTQVVTYTMLGAKETSIKSLVEADIKKQIDTSEQGILNQGIVASAFKLKEATATGASMNIQTVAVVGPSLSTQDIAKESAGKKSGDIKSTVSSTPGVTNVEVKLSPFWVTKAPKNTSKITVTIAKPTNAANGN